MKVLVIGGGGREHAIAWKLGQSPKVPGVCCARAITALSANPNIAITDVRNCANGRRRKDRLTVVGPEAPLAGRGR